jgi:ubiquinone/menaquinone biosynthesis C-methylase UbiE
VTQLAFDESVARRIESLYLTRDAERRRGLVREALQTAPGYRVIDIGCGPGFYCLELAAEVRAGGAVVGIDSSAPMLALAARRCEAHENVSFREADLLSLPVEEASFDRALCVQVLEYIEDATAALTEMLRVLRPGGRVVIWDTDWATVSMHSSDPERMHRVMKAWDSHLTHPSLPRTLGPRLRDAGFEKVEATAHVFATVGELSQDSFASSMLPLISNYVVGNNLIDADEAAAWEAEQQQLSEADGFYYTSTQFCLSAVRPLLGV